MNGGCGGGGEGEEGLLKEDKDEVCERAYPHDGLLCLVENRANERVNGSGLYAWKESRQGSGTKET